MTLKKKEIFFLHSNKIKKNRKNTTQFQPQKNPTGMRKTKKLEEAIEILANTPGQSADPPRVWSGEYTPFESKETGKTIQGIRFYLVGTTSQMYDRVCSISDPEKRNFYEVIAGRCHFYADYDLKTPSPKSVAAAHAAFSASLRAILDPNVVASVTEHILVGHIPGRKESMHVRWEFRDPGGALVMLSCPEDGRRLSSCAISRILPRHPDTGEIDYAASPLFYIDESTGRPACVLDYGVYNKNRNFRLAGNVKPKLPGKCRGWLVPAAQNAAGPDVEVVMPPRSVFYENLVCYVPGEDEPSVRILDVAEFPDGLDDIRADVLGKHSHLSCGAGAHAHKRSAPDQDGAGRKRFARDNSVGDEAGDNSEMLACQRRVEGIIENMLSAHAGEDVRTVKRSGGVFTMRIDGRGCPIKGGDHEDSNNGYFIVRMGYPMPRAYRRCWKTKCEAIQLSRPPEMEELEPNETYKAEVEKLMKLTAAELGKTFLYLK